MPTPPPPAEDSEPLPYEECTDATYAEHAEGFAIEQVGRSTVLRGTCRRCEHAMEYIISGHVVRTAARWPFSRARSEPPTPPTTDIEMMICTCDADHPHRPSGFSGCGAFWNVTLSAS